MDRVVYGCNDSSGAVWPWGTEVALYAKGTEPLCTQPLPIFIQSVSLSNNQMAC